MTMTMYFFAPMILVCAATAFASSRGNDLGIFRDEFAKEPSRLSDRGLSVPYDRMFTRHFDSQIYARTSLGDELPSEDGAQSLVRRIALTPAALKESIARMDRDMTRWGLEMGQFRDFTNLPQKTQENIRNNVQGTMQRKAAFRAERQFGRQLLLQQVQGLRHARRQEEANMYRMKIDEWNEKWHQYWELLERVHRITTRRGYSPAKGKSGRGGRGPGGQGPPGSSGGSKGGDHVPTKGEEATLPSGWKHVSKRD